MLKRFEVSNFMNFKDLFVFDLSDVGGYQFNNNCINNKLISKGIIYGRNAAGKTNLGRALQDICFVLSGFRNIGNDYSLNADSGEKGSLFKYVFLFDDEEIIYEYKRISNAEMESEKVLISGNVLFDLDYINKNFKQIDLKIIHEENIIAEKYINTLKTAVFNPDSDYIQPPFLRVLLNNAVLSHSSVLAKLDKFVSDMCFVGVSSQIMNYRLKPWAKSRIELLSEGNNRKDFEDFLESFGIKCKLLIEELPDGRKELYFKHKNFPIPFFETASSGTHSLTNLYFRLFLPGRNASFVYLDEFDAFYHFEMSETIVKTFKEKYPNVQIIMTTHNTNLMTNQLLRPDCLFILSTQGRITPLCKATERELREGHNLEKLYIAGEFEKYE